MLDDNLPTFFLRPSAAEAKHHRDIYSSYHGSDPAPAYTLQYPDPNALTTQASRNCYAAGLLDAYNPEILFAEVLIQPGWTQPTLSQEEIRKNRGIPPPPQPVVPTEFSLQLYNPEQQVHIEVKEGKWGASDTYEFAMPISTFRTPSASTLDRGQSDPANLPNTPKVFFVWRRESKLSKDLTCFMTGKSTDTLDGKKKKRTRNDPDIAIALWRNLRELTIYEPNLTRIEMEDPKGLELVLLLSSIVLKDLYLNNKDDVRALFNVSAPGIEGRNTSAGRNTPLSNSARSNGNLADARGSGGLAYPTAAFRQSAPNSSVQAKDARAQWEIDAETARLRAQVEEEERASRAAHERRRKAKEKEDEAERKRLMRIVEDEQRAEQRRKAEIERETERLRRMYGSQAPPDHFPEHQQPSSALRYSHPVPVMSGANPAIHSSPDLRQKPTKKKSFFGLRTTGN